MRSLQSRSDRLEVCFAGREAACSARRVVSALLKDNVFVFDAAEFALPLSEQAPETDALDIGTVRNRSLECHSGMLRPRPSRQSSCFVRPSQRFLVPEMLEMFLNVESACRAER